MTSARRAWFLVGIGVAGVSLSGPMVTAIAAPTLVVAFWRNAFGSAATAPLALSRPAEWRALDGATWRAGVFAGALLAVHFGLWIPSLRMTSVTVSTALVATAPLWTVVLHGLAGRRPGRGVLAGVSLALAGILVITGVDATGSGRALLGDLLALGGGIAGAGYTVVGEHVRRTASTPVYTLLAYTVCALLLGLVCVAAGLPLTGYPPSVWGWLVALTVAAQLLGHTCFNQALPTLGATPVSLAILLEVPGAALVAWAWLGQVPPIAVLPGAILVLAGLVVVVRDS